MVCIGKDEHSFLEWGTHRITHDSPARMPERELIETVLPQKSINIVEGIEEEVVVWYAYKERVRDMKELFPRLAKDEPSIESHQVFLNTFPSIRFLKPEDQEKSGATIGWNKISYYIHLDIKFAPIDKKPRKYHLHVTTWDDLGLDEQTS
jgi:hypothetical protein